MKTNTNEYAQNLEEFLQDIFDRLGPDDFVVTFDQLMEGAGLEDYLSPEKENQMGRPRYNRVDMLKVVLLGFMENGYISLRTLQDRCKSNLRYIYLMKGKMPSYRSFGYFIRNELSVTVEQLFLKIIKLIDKKEGIDLQHLYIDGTKIEANANKYSWVWKKGTEKSRFRLYKKISELLTKMNAHYSSMQFDVNTEYSPEGIQNVIDQYKEGCEIDETVFVKGRGYRKSFEQKCYEVLNSYKLKLSEYVQKISICGPDRNSYSKTDQDATFMRIKKDYMGNDQLLPAYNIQVGVSDEYIVVPDVQQYRTDHDCYIPLIEKFHKMYGFYPKYTPADAGYGSYNNYIYCEQHGIEKYMKFTMYKKQTEDKEYRENPYRAENFKKDDDGNIICPNNRKMVFAYKQNVRNNKYGRQEEVYVCEDCSECPFADDCKKTSRNRTIRMNSELSSMYQEVVDNLQSIHGALLLMNRSIQAEGTFGIVK